MSFTLHGISASKGIAIGKVSVLERSQLEVREFTLEPDLIEAEVARFTKAVSMAKEQLALVRDRLPQHLAGQVASFIEVHLLMLEDAAIAKAPIEHIRSRGCNAEWAQIGRAHV